MRLSLPLACSLVLLVISCAPAPTPASTVQIISVHATPAAQPWLADLFACAPAGTVMSVANDPAGADISVRLGEPKMLSAPAYQIGAEELLIVTHRQSPVQNLSASEARALFAGQAGSPVQVWVYASGEDVQGVFEGAVMQGQSVTSLARLATSPQQMSDTLVNEPDSVGILPRRWKAGDARIVFSIPDVPVLAIVKEEPQGALRDLLACLQK